MRALVLALLLVPVGCSEEPESPAAAAERIVLIVVDTLRRDHLGVYGGKVATPNIDALAARGQVFASLSSSYHQTTMSMASLFTGRTPSIERGDARYRLRWTGETWCGMARFASPGMDDECIPRAIPTLAEALRNAGYWTAGVVSNELLYRPGGYERGFQTWFEFEKGTPTALQVNHVVRQLLEKRARDRFFLYVHYMDVHSYYRDKVRYASRVASIDTAVGQLTEALRDAGLMDGTVVIFTADHGERLGERHFVEGTRGHIGSPSFESLLEVPLIVAPPVFPDDGSVLRSDDLHRLILALAGAEASAEPDLEPGELFLSERHYQTYRVGRWKSFRNRRSGLHSLVDLEADPHERVDVAARHPDRVASHAARMDELTSKLAGRAEPGRQLSEDDRTRLRALGYDDSE